MRPIKTKNYFQMPMNSMSNFHLRASVLYATVAMFMGLFMAIGKDHSLLVSHAHLNLAGWVSTALYGIFLRLFPDGSGGLLSKIQAVLAHGGVIVMTIGLAGLAYQKTFGEPLAGIGSIGVLLGMLLFAVMVFKATAD